MIASNTSKKEEEKNQALALRYHNDIFQKGKLEVAYEILAPDFVLHNPLLPKELRNGPEETKKYASAVISAVPDRKLVHDDFFAKGDKVLIRWTNSGTNTGPLFGNPAPSFFSSSIRLVNCCSSSMSSSHSFPILDFLLYYSIEKMFTSVGLRCTIQEYG